MLPVTPDLCPSCSGGSLPGAPEAACAGVPGEGRGGGAHALRPWVVLPRMHRTAHSSFASLQAHNLHCTVPTQCCMAPKSLHGSYIALHGSHTALHGSYISLHSSHTALHGSQTTAGLPHCTTQLLNRCADPMPDCMTHTLYFAVPTRHCRAPALYCMAPKLHCIAPMLHWMVPKPLQVSHTALRSSQTTARLPRLIASPPCYAAALRGSQTTAGLPCLIVQLLCCTAQLPRCTVGLPKTTVQFSHRTAWLPNHTAQAQAVPQPGPVPGVAPQPLVPAPAPFSTRAQLTRVCANKTTRPPEPATPGDCGHCRLFVEWQGYN